MSSPSQGLLLSGIISSSLAIAACSATSSPESDGTSKVSQAVSESASAQADQPSAAAAAAAAARVAQAQLSQIQDQYIVKLKPGVAASPSSPTGRPVASVASDVALAHGAQVGRIYEHALQGMVVKATPDQLARLRQDSRVEYVVPDGIAYANDDQANATWGIDRIDQRNLPLDQIYSYEGYGTNVHAYVIDTGLYAEHKEFAGRVQPGYDFIDNDDDPDDCESHGTHVAGTVLGTTYGVAKHAMIHAVRVLDCGGSGTWSTVIAGIDWVAANHVKPAVANMSLGGGFNQAVNDAVTGSVAAGVTYAISAGNDYGGSACGKSPASTPTAMTVASSTSTDARSSFSNIGPCVDIYAPGSSITSAGIDDPDATSIKSGTSMASPHVAGVAALYLGGHPEATPEEVMAALADEATPDLITDAGADTPNLLLYMGDLPGDNLSKGLLKLDSEAACDSTITVGLTDQDLEGAGSQAVTVTTSGGDSESLDLIEDAGNLGRFASDLQLATGSVVIGDGVIQTAGGEQVDVTYEDADDGEGNPATTTKSLVMDCVGPDISNVDVTGVTATAAVVQCQASEVASLQASYGLDCGALTATTELGSASATPETTLSGLQPNTTYYFALTAVDELGNETTSDNAGACYSFTTPNPVLLEDFESGLGIFTAESGLWHASTGCNSILDGHSQPGTLLYAQESTCNFNTGATTAGVARSISIPIDLSANASLQFNYFLGTEGGTIYDQASAEVAVNGATPIVVASSYGLGTALLANSGEWQSATVDLTSLGTGVADIELLFRFDSVDSIANSYPGFYVDDVELYQTVSSCSSSLDCDDGVPCTVDSCDLESQTCSNVPDDVACDDGLFCNGIEACTMTGCEAGSAPACDDGIACTIDICSEETDSCDYSPDDAACNNGAYCDGTETCAIGVGCEVGTPVECNDGIDCTIDACDEELDACGATADDLLCDNGLFCDGAELCDLMEGCTAGELPCTGECNEELNECTGQCQDVVYEAETMIHSTGGSYEGGWNIWSNGYAAFTHGFSGGSTDLTVTAAGTYANGEWPNMVVTVGGVEALQTAVESDTWTEYTFSFDAPVGDAEVQVHFTNDYYQDGEDRNLLLDKVTVLCVETGPTCTDGVSNGDETGVDCGGPTCAACPNDQPCNIDSDCMSGFCSEGICADAPVTCGNGTLDPGEECDDGNTEPGDGCDESCMIEAECGNGTLDPGEECDDGNLEPGDGCDASCMIEATCDDGINNGEETGVDCGGPVCSACPNDQPCNIDGDCISGNCSEGICAPVEGELSASLSVSTDWGGGYCVVVDVTNGAASATTDWAVTVDTNGSSIYTSWSGTFSGGSGEVGIVPTGWNNVIQPSSTDSSIGFCANRDSEGTELPFVLSAEGVY